MEIKEINKENMMVTLIFTEEEYENHFAMCGECGELMLISEAVYLDGEYFHKDCLHKCCCCGRYLRADDCWHTQDSDYSYCESCFDENTYVCADCGDHYRYEDEMHEIGDDYYCDDCYENHRSIIGDYHDMKNNAEIIFYGEKDRKHFLHMGCELEVDSDSRVPREEIAKGVRERLSSFVELEHDGSLSSYGFEIVTFPATLQYHLDMMPRYRETFQYLMDSGMQSHDVGRCGLHCHIDRRYLGKKEDSTIAKLLYLFEKFRSELTRFSRRTDGQLSDWCRFRKENYSGEAGWIKKAIYDSKNGYGYRDRYYAINLTNCETIEFRLFRGTLNIETFEATLKFIHRLVTLCKHTRAVELAKMSFDELLGDDVVIRSYWNRVRNRVTD